MPAYKFSDINCWHYNAGL